ncbi:MAG: threonylcarbamoyl-AMP synthase [Chloroflexi bacterium]|nr:threonylcarbamoyl-AMP synthase [Chloroflexota bacterium]
MLTWPDDDAGQRELADSAAQVLRASGLVVYPTDTVYGLGALPSLPDAIQRIYAVKGRPDEKAIVWLVSSGHDVAQWCGVDSRFERLAERFWPGALTLVLPRLHPQADGLRTLGVRVPAHPAALRVIEAAGGVVATTSANRAGRASARTARDAASEIGNHVDLIIDGGAAPVGVESTVLDLSTDPVTVLRAGAIPVDEIESVIGASVARLSY